MARPKLHRNTKAQLLLQYGDACHICRLRMRFESPSDHPLSATFDHLIPRSVEKAPYYKRSNLKLAHKLCNNLRGVLDIDDELRSRCKTAVEQLLRTQGF